MRQRRAVLEDEIQRIEWALAHGMPRRLSLEVMPAGSNGAAAAAAAAAALVAGRATSTNGLAQRTDSISSPTDTGAVAVAAAAAAVASAPDVLSRLEARRTRPVRRSLFHPLPFTLVARRSLWQRGTSDLPSADIGVMPPTRRRFAKSATRSARSTGRACAPTTNVSTRCAPGPAG